MSEGGTRLAVFDCDGTLVDSQRVIVASMIAAFEGEGLPPPPDAAIRHVVGLPLLGAIQHLAPAGADADRVADRYRDAFGDLAARPDWQEPLFPGVRQTLDRLQAAGFLLGIATGKGRRGLGRLLERHGLLDHFATLQTADDGPGKPNPSMLLAAMAEAGAEPAATVMIGDTTYDVLMAKAARVAAIGVDWGYHEPAELSAAGAARVAHAFADLPAMIEDLVRVGLCV